MKAFIRKSYGGPDVLQLQEIDRPAVSDGQILLRVMANAANPADWHILRGKPFFARFTFGLFKPKEPVIGADFAGIVVAIGNNTKQWKIGDRVFGETLMGGAFAAYVCVPETACAAIPAELSFADAAGLPVAGLTALQGLLTHGQLKAGETVLINGASGGVGHFAVQIAKAYGAVVTAVCSARNTAFVTSLGADTVIAYDQTNIHRHQQRYDLVIDTHGNLSYKDFQRMGRRAVVTGFTTVAHMMGLALKKMMGKVPLSIFTAAANTDDLQTLGKLLASGKIRVHIDSIKAMASGICW